VRLVSRLVIDAHVHPQRFTPGFLKRGEPFTYDKLEDSIMIFVRRCDNCWSQPSLSGLWAAHSSAKQEIWLKSVRDDLISCQGVARILGPAEDARRVEV
jgi:hypothetical protein